MSQHFLLTAAARSLSLGQVLRLSDEEAHARFVAIRFADNDGAPFCPRCGCVDVYAIPTRRTWQCKACKKQFLRYVGNNLCQPQAADPRLPRGCRDFCNHVKGISALALGRDLNVQYKTAFVLAHKLNEAMGTQVHNPDQAELSGTVEVDGAYFGG